MFNHLSEKLKRTLKDLPRKGRRAANITDAMREVRIALLEADVSLEVTKVFVDRINNRVTSPEVMKSLSPGQITIKIIKEELMKLMGESNDSLILSKKFLSVILIVGLPGSGKTTSVGKLGYFLKERENKSVLVASTDVYRPAASEQLQCLAKKGNLQYFFPEKSQQNSIGIALSSIDYAKKQKIDVVILDTAGFFHLDTPMMKAMHQLCQVTNPIEKLIVVDSMTGQDAVNSAKAFNKCLPITGVILTKTDGDARGGAALSVRQVTGKSIKFMGTGEAIDALEPFYPDRVASRILGMGDMLSLLEAVEHKVDKKKSEKMEIMLKQGRGFNLEHFKEQMLQMEKMGGMIRILDKIPGIGNISQNSLEQLGSKQTKKTIAIINSMTPYERRCPEVLEGRDRKKRISLGSGTRVQDVNRLLKQFIKMQKMLKTIHKKGRKKGSIKQFIDSEFLTNHK